MSPTRESYPEIIIEEDDNEWRLREMQEIVDDVRQSLRERAKRLREEKNQ